MSKSVLLLSALVCLGWGLGACGPTLTRTISPTSTAKPLIPSPLPVATAPADPRTPTPLPIATAPADPRTPNPIPIATSTADPRTPTPIPTATSTPRAPTLTATPVPTPTSVSQPVRAVRLDFANVAHSRAEVEALEQKLLSAGVNMVALGAGRPDWTYFKWEGREEWWSSHVRETGIDFLAEDAARFGQWAHVSAVLDVYAARYVELHPEDAAISRRGRPSRYLVSTMELVKGHFGDHLLEMLDYIAHHYPVDSIALTELAYYTEGYGEEDKAAYLAYTGRTDWPRTLLYQIDVNHPSIGEWRSREIGRFLDRAATVTHRYGKELFVDVRVSWGHLERQSVENGQDYGVVLQHADRLVVWDYFGLTGYKPDYTREIARYLSDRYGPQKVIISVGLWGPRNSAISPNELRQAMQAAVEGGIPHLWITPSHYLSEKHWQVLAELWGDRE